MSEQVVITLILAGQAIMVAIIGLLGVLVSQLKGAVKNVKKDTEAAREQVENNHRHPDGTPINLREEGDERHFAVLGKIEGLKESFETKLESVAKDIGGLRQENRDDRKAQREDQSANRESLHIMSSRIDTVTAEVATITTDLMRVTSTLINKQ